MTNKIKPFFDLFFALFTVIVIASCTTLAATVSVINSATFVSNSDQQIQAVYRDNDTVTLTFPDSRIEILNLAVSASGARYISGKKEWWEHQGKATYSINDQVIFTGRQALNP
jgi:membrane-bound inhibitor of C-type lysozyme